jgi:hypothetical protein
MQFLPDIGNGRPTPTQTLVWEVADREFSHSGPAQGVRGISRAQLNGKIPRESLDLGITSEFRNDAGCAYDNIFTIHSMLRDDSATLPPPSKRRLYVPPESRGVYIARIE